MSKPVARILDTCTGHDSFPSRPAIEGSPDIFYNGKQAHRQNDDWAIHFNNKTAHSGKLASGSTVVFANGKQQGRTRDPITCGSYVNTGSPDIFIG